MPPKTINLIDRIDHADRVSFTAECEGNKKLVTLSLDRLKNISKLPASADIADHFDEASHSIIQVLRRYFGTCPDLNPILLGENDFL